MARDVLRQARTDVDYACLGNNTLVQMNILILGAGQVGTTAAHHLAKEEANEVTIVDSNAAVLRDL